MKQHLLRLAGGAALAVAVLGVSSTGASAQSGHDGGHGDWRDKKCGHSCEMKDHKKMHDDKKHDDKKREDKKHDPKRHGGYGMTTSYYPANQTAFSGNVGGIYYANKAKNSSGFGGGYGSSHYPANQTAFSGNVGGIYYANTAKNSSGYGGDYGKKKHCNW